MGYVYGSFNNCSANGFISNKIGGSLESKMNCAIVADVSFSVTGSASVEHSSMIFIVSVKTSLIFVSMFHNNYSNFSITDNFTSGSEMG